MIYALDSCTYVYCCISSAGWYGLDTSTALLLHGRMREQCVLNAMVPLILARKCDTLVEMYITHTYVVIVFCIYYPFIGPVYLAPSAYMSLSSPSSIIMHASFFSFLNIHVRL